MTHTPNDRHSEILPNASQHRTREPLSRLARPRCSGPALLKRIGKPAWPVKLLAAAAVVAAFAAALALSASSQRLEAQTDGASPEPEIQVSGRQSLSSVPSDAVRLYYNCTEVGEMFSPTRHSYVRVFSSRNQSSCSGYEEGDYILRVFVEGYFPGLYYPSGTLRFDVDFVFHIVGGISWAGEADRVDGFDYFVDGTRRSVSPYGCGTDLASRSLSFGGSVFETTLLCRDAYWQNEYAPHWEVPVESTAIHILPPSFTEWPLPLVQVIRLEVTQGVQDWNNSLNLVRNRRTVVRAFMETGLERQREITARLKGQKKSADDTTLFVETTYPVNPGKYITVMPDVIERRGDIDASLNFVLPKHWTDLEADEELWLELVFEPGSNHNCYETITHDDRYNRDADIYNRCVETIEFTEVVAPEIVIVPVPLETADGTVRVPSSGMLTAQVDRIKSALPFSDFKFSFSNYFKEQEPLEFETSLLEINEMMQYDKDFVDEDGNVVYLCVVLGTAEDNNDKIDHSDDDSGYWRGAAYYGYQGGRVGSWYTHEIDGLQPETDRHFGHERNIGTHELGHILGLHHPGWIVDGKLFGMCGEIEDLEEAEELNNPKSLRLHDPIIMIPQYIPGGEGDSKFPRPGLGPWEPFGNPDLEVWGVDTGYVGRYHRGAFYYREIYDVLSVIDPNLVFSLMSYCSAVAESSQEDGKGKFVDCLNRNSFIEGKYVPECEFHRGGQGSWLDSSRHEYLVRCLSAQTCLSSEPDVNVARAVGDSSMADSDLLSGSVLFSPSGTATGAVLDPVFSMPRSFRTPRAGEYTLELRDASGGVLREVSFATYQSSEGIPQEEAGFSLVVPSLPDYASFAIVQSDTELAVIPRSANAPAVSISGITEGQAFASDDSIDLSWKGTDSDGDELFFKLYYSVDGGDTYKTLLRPTASTSVSYSADLLEGSSTARIGISVSDGTRSSFAQMPVFSVAQHRPQVLISTPFSGAVFAERQGFILEASGYDVEDGNLSSSAFRWSSDIDGNLGTGEMLVLSADRLTAGSHTITVAATDSDQMTSTATVNITISNRNMLPVANDDEAFGGYEETLQIDVLANDTDIEGDFDLSTLTIDRYPRFGIAEVAMTEAGIPVVEYSPFTGGEDSFSYYICDGLYRCDSAEVTVVFPDCTITGTRGSDNLVGTSGDDVICGLDGDDFIDGKAGNDLIYAGFGEDVVAGRTGDDTIYGGPGNDLILGHRGDDTIYGGLSDDTLYGGGGDDTIYGGDETDEVYGEAGNDILYGGDGPDKIHGGQGDDTIYGGKRGDTIRGNAGTDTIYPGTGNNAVLGNSQADTVLNEVFF